MGAEAQLVCSQIVTSVLSRSQLNIKMSPEESNTTRMLEFSPKIRSGSYADIGPRSFMEDEHLIIDDLSMHLGSCPCPCPKPSALYGVFDGHGGSEAATFVRNNFTRFFFQDINFPHSSDFDNFFLQGVEDCLRRAFLSADLALSDEPSISTSSGTTALTALIFGTLLLVANAGDCRAVLSRKGKAIDLSQDHRPTYPSEKRRVEELGGFVDDGYLNGVLSVTRALGDWDMKLPCGSASSSASASPLIAEPELRQITLTEDDEFLIIGCDGIWDVMSSQEAVSLVRRGLRQHDDPDLCAKELVKEALRLHTADNLTVIVVCLSSLERQREQSVTGSWRPRRLKCSLSAEALSALRSIIDN